MIRIVSGTHKGRRIAAPKNLPVRPTTDRTKESLFNILNHRLDWETVRMLDLYAGTGNLSYEAASRGCRDITAVDIHPGCAAFIRKTAAELEMPIQVFRQDAMAYLGRDHSSYDLILADPPYDVPLDSLEKFVVLCLDESRLNPGGMCILEHSKEYDVSGLEGFEEVRYYGGTALSFFSKE